MIHDFGIVWSERDLLLAGLGNTTILSVLSAVAALLIGFALTPRPEPLGSGRCHSDRAASSSSSLELRASFASARRRYSSGSTCAANACSTPGSR